MINKEHIQNQLELLETHRQTLAHYLKQSAMIGMAFTPPAIEHGIREAREYIQQIKNYLRNQGVVIEDFPGDEWPVMASTIPSSIGASTYPTKAARLTTHRGRTVDREQELQNFQKMLQQEIALRGLIIHSEGEGGWGKSSLLRLFDKECALCTSPTTEALLFAPGDTGADWKRIMQRTAYTLGHSYFPRYLAAASGHTSEDSAYFADEGEGVIEDVGVEYAQIEISRYRSDRSLKHPSQRGRLEQLQLTEIFLQEFQNVPAPNQFVWLVDTAEQLDHETEVWLLKIFRRIVLGELTRLILVVAGRHPLNTHPSWQGRIQEVRLGPLDITAVLQLLPRSLDETESKRRAFAKRLIKQTRGKPQDIRVFLDNMYSELEV